MEIHLLIPAAGLLMLIPGKTCNKLILKTSRMTLTFLYNDYLKISPDWYKNTKGTAKSSKLDSLPNEKCPLSGALVLF